MKDKPRFAFFGTPHFATVVLDALETHGFLPTLVVTAPDKPHGRGLEIKPSPAKAWAEARGIDVITPTTLKEIPDELQNTEWDVFVVAAYAKLLPQKVLLLPHRKALNVHPSLLPKFRGPSPALSAILADERTTGVSIMQMSEKMDEGPVVAQARVEILPEDWPPKGSILEDMLAQEGGNLLAEVMEPWLKGEITPEVQDESRASYTKKFSDADARVDIEGDAHEVLLKIRAFDKNPRAYFLHRDKRVIITDAHIADGKLELLRVIPEGKSETDFKSYRASRAYTL